MLKHIKLNMRCLISFALFIIFESLAFTQNNCDCKDNPSLKEFVNCDTLIFKNNSKLYTQFNCDSSWITFENNKGIKNIISSLQDEWIELTSKLGFQFVTEFEKGLLFEIKQASGCCFPSPIVLLNKDNGEVIEEIGNIIFYNDTIYNFVIYFSNDSLDSLTLYYIDTGKKYQFSIPKERFKQTINQTGVMYPEFLFEEPTILNFTYTFIYKYQNQGDTNKWNKDKINIDLRKFAP